MLNEAVSNALLLDDMDDDPRTTTTLASLPTARVDRSLRVMC
jgi:hypothetical protein